MAKEEKKSSKKAPATADKKTQLLVDIKALPVIDRRIVNRRTIDLVKLEDVVELVKKTL